MRFEKSCGAVIYRYHENELQVLLVKQHPGGHWAFPKGHVETNETEQETARREIKEETGLDVEIDTTFRHTVEYQVAADAKKEVVYFAAIPTSDIIVRQANEIQAIEWISVSKAVQRVTYQNDRGVLMHFMDHIKEV